MLVDIFKKKITTKRTPGGREGGGERDSLGRERERTEKENQWQGFEKISGGNMVFLIGI